MTYQATTCHSNDYNKIFEKANAALTKGKTKKAIDLYYRVLRIRQDLPQVYFNLGISLLKEKRYDEAINNFRQAIRLKKDYVKAYHQLGIALQNIGQTDEAAKIYQQAHDIDQTYVGVITPLAYIKREQDDFKGSADLFGKAHQLRPNDAQILLEYANTLNTGHFTQEALEGYYKLDKMIPNNPAILYNIGYTLKKLNRVEEALPYYDRTLALKPDHAEAHFSHGLALLVTGDTYPGNWAKGWQEYEWRWRRNGKQRLRQYVQPVWDGRSLNGKILFIWSEQGLGDTFEFVRYAKVAKELGARKVIVAVQKPLLDIIKLCPYIDQVIWTQEQPPYFDYHVPMLSMPYHTRVSLDNVPNKVPYLYADPALVTEWKEILKSDTNFKIGICWQGNPNYSTQFLRQAVAAKSMSVTKFLPIMNMPGVSVYSLQKTTGTKQLADLPEDAPLIIFGDDFDQSKGRFMDTAAVMKNLDLVLTIDTSICHIAAGLGVPTWNLLPTPPDWRWMIKCDNTPWYPNMRLFRQPTPGDWDSVIEKVVYELQEHLQNGKPLITFEQPIQL